MRKFFKRSKSSKILIMGVIVALCFAVTGWAKAGQDREERGFTDFTHIEEEYLSTLKSLDFPEGTVLPEKLEGEDSKASFQEGYGETRACNLWEYSWMQEWLDTYTTEPERAEQALNELEKAFDMAYMGEDRCDDATRNYLRENIDKAKAGDPSGFEECIRVNYAE